MGLSFTRKEDIRALVSIIFVVVAMIWPIIEEVFSDLLSSYPDLSTVVVGIATATIGIYFGVRQASVTIDPPPLGLPARTIRGVLIVLLVVGVIIGALNPAFTDWHFIAGFFAAFVGWLYGHQ